MLRKLILLIPVLALAACSKPPVQKPCPVCVATPAKIVKVQDRTPCLPRTSASLVLPFIVVDYLTKVAASKVQNGVKVPIEQTYNGTQAEEDALAGYAAGVVRDLQLAHKLCGPRTP